MALTSAARREYTCGPVRLDLHVPGEQWLSRLDSALAMYDAPWEGGATFRVHVEEQSGAAPDVAGNYLRCARYRVDGGPRGLIGASLSGAWCQFSPLAGTAWVHVPGGIDDELIREDVEQFLLLVMTVGWRLVGWTPLHVGSLLRADRCALVCATAGTGKSTLVAALIRRGWKTLGDDKLLARREADGAVIAAALSLRMNLDPLARRWFPEIGDLSVQAPYSRWTNKRKLKLNAVWPGCVVERATPTHVLLLGRGGGVGCMGIEPVSCTDSVEALARQVVMPQDAPATRMIMDTVAAIATSTRGLRVTVGDDAHANPSALARLEEALA